MSGVGWLVGLLGAALCAGAWWWSQRRQTRYWAQMGRVLDALGDGRDAEDFTFPKGGRFAPLTYKLEKIAQLQAKLRAAIQREEFNLETILASMEEGVMVVDAQHVLRQVNPSFLQLFALKTEPHGQTVLQTLRDPQVEEMVTAALKTGEAQAREISINGNKPLRHLAVYAVTMSDDTGQRGVVTIFRDISRLRQLEEVRREFVANVSHELRTPLSIFHGYLENLLDDPTMPRKDQAEVFEILRKHSLRLNALLEDLLILARLEARHETLQPEPIHLLEFITEAAADWKSRALKKKIGIAVEVPTDLPELPADPLRLEQIFTNLLENALKYTEEGGRIAIQATAEEGWIELRVADSGVGIPPSDLPHIFERFYRADKARSREQGGTGLGLSIVKHIVQLHGGTVRAESTYGEGTTIIIRLPRTPAPLA